MTSNFQNWSSRSGKILHDNPEISLNCYFKATWQSALCGCRCLRPSHNPQRLPLHHNPTSFLIKFTHSYHFLFVSINKQWFDDHRSLSSILFQYYWLPRCFVNQTPSRIASSVPVVRTTQSCSSAINFLSVSAIIWALILLRYSIVPESFNTSF